MMRSATVVSTLKILAFIGCLMTFALSGCVQVKTEPIKIEPIYIEITINHKVQKELDDVFADIDAASETADFGTGAPTGN
jgi:hypothetical protein